MLLPVSKIAWRGLLACIALLAGAAVARADGGTVQKSEVVGPLRITLFTAPTPLRAGAVDASVLVQDAASGSVLDDAEVEMQWSARQAPGNVLHAQATRAAATNKLLRAAQFDLPHTGEWQLTAKVSAAGSQAEVSAIVAVGAPLPKWQAMWPWYGWPVLVVILFAWREWSAIPRR